MKWKPLSKITTKNRPHLGTGGGLLGLIVGAGVLVIWLITGRSAAPLSQTLWDWLELLLTPVALAGSVVLIGQQLRFREKQGRQEKVFSEEAIRHQRDLETDRFQAAALQTYLDRMTELMLERGLRVSPVNAEVRSLARARTLTILRELDGRRKGLLVQFLHAAQLIKGKTAFDLAQADLRGADLSHTNLVEVVLAQSDLSGASLREATLRRANLNGCILIVADLSGTDFRAADLRRARLVEATVMMADLGEADLSGADLHGANLEGANLAEAELGGANLAGAYLGGANLIGASLHGANLRGADLTEANLREADLSGADLTGAVLDRADLLETRLVETKVSHQQLAGARMIRPLPELQVQD